MDTLSLAGVKILDFTTLLPGPYATHLLCEMGAEVTRIEAPDRPDLLKMMPPLVDGVSAAFRRINRNKQTHVLDLKSERAQAQIIALLLDHDIVVEGFRPGVMARFGLDYERLKAHCPGLIYCSITGYGQTGPYRDRAGHDINYLALSGLASYSGTAETGPVLSGLQIADIAGGSHHAVMAIQGAIIHRLKTGAGQYLDISMTDSARRLSTVYLAGVQAGGKAPRCGSELLNGGSFYGYYRTLDGRHLSVGSLEPKFQQGLKQALNLKQLNRHTLTGVIASQPLAHWVELFARFDVCVEPVLTLDELSQHPVFKDRPPF
jgi:crotonobetainyl-CoA:carnitine CoA-transferase CaiB-like acyl-CoA transferase